MGQGLYLLIATFLLGNSGVRFRPSHSCAGLTGRAAPPVQVQQVAAGLAVLSRLADHLGSQRIFINQILTGDFVASSTTDVSKDDLWD